MPPSDMLASMSTTELFLSLFSTSLLNKIPYPAEPVMREMLCYKQHLLPPLSAFSKHHKTVKSSPFFWGGDWSETCSLLVLTEACHGSRYLPTVGRSTTCPSLHSREDAGSQLVTRECCVALLQQSLHISLCCFQTCLHRFFRKPKLSQKLLERPVWR